MPQEQPKLYILVRRDLSVPQQTVQACHALASLSLTAALEEWQSHDKDDHPYFNWIRDDGPIAILGVRDLEELLEYNLLLSDARVSYEVFVENAMNSEPTALAVMPGTDEWYFRKLGTL